MTERWVRFWMALSAVLSVLFAFGLVADIRAGGDTGLKGRIPNSSNPSEQAGSVFAAGGGPGEEAAAGNGAGGAGGGGTGLQVLGPTRKETQAPVSGGIIKVGGIFSETGPLAAGAEADTVKAYFQMVNDQGGVNGYKLQLVEKDDGFDATRGQTQARELVEKDGVFAIVGWLAPNTEPSVVDYFQSKGVPMIGGLGVPQEFGPSLSFPVSVNLGEVGKLCKYVLDALLGMKRPAAWFVDLTFIKEAMGPAVACLKQHGVEPVEVKTISAAEPDYNSHVLSARAKGADSLFLGFDPFSYVRIFNALQQQGWHPPTFAWALTNTQVLAAIPRDALEGVGTTSPTLVDLVHPNNPEVRLYQATMKKYYPNTFRDPYTIISWAAAKVFVEALRRAGPSPTRQSLVDALNSFSGFRTGVTADITYRPGPHNPSPCAEGLAFQGGQIKDVYPHWICLDGTRPFPPE